MGAGRGPAMANDDFEDFVVGTALYEEEMGQRFVPTKATKPLWEQNVVDAEGRRRFHGAFTGGYSAGYFNTARHAAPRRAAHTPAAAPREDGATPLCPLRARELLLSRRCQCARRKPRGGT